jgi:predicted metal-dependent phosphoesterase TrpH
VFKIDLHIHTRLGGDSLIAPEEIVERAREVGLDAVCITEHHSYDLSEPVDEISRIADFPIFRGMEYRADNGHVLIYGVRVSRGNLPSGLPVQKAVDWVQKNGGVAIPAHPYQHAQEAAKRLQINGIGGSDAHGLQVMGKAYTCFPAAVTSMEELVAALKDENYFPVWNKYYEAPEETVQQPLIPR